MSGKPDIGQALFVVPAKAGTQGNGTVFRSPALLGPRFRGGADGGACASVQARAAEA